jgi:hypothetical protein
MGKRRETWLERNWPPITLALAAVVMSFIHVVMTDKFTSAALPAWQRLVLAVLPNVISTTLIAAVLFALIRRDFRSNVAGLSDESQTADELRQEIFKLQGNVETAMRLLEKTVMPSNPDVESVAAANSDDLTTSAELLTLLKQVVSSAPIHERTLPERLIATDDRTPQATESEASRPMYRPYGSP